MTGVRHVSAQHHGLGDRFFERHGRAGGAAETTENKLQHTRTGSLGTLRAHLQTASTYKSQLSAANLLLVNEASSNYSWFVLPQLELQKDGCMHFSYNAAKRCPFVHQHLLVQPKIKFQILTSSLSNRVIMRTDESFCRLSPPQEPTRPWSANQKRNMSHIIHTNGTR